MEFNTSLSVVNQTLESFLMTFKYAGQDGQSDDKEITIPLQVLAQSEGFAEYWVDELPVEKIVVAGGYGLMTVQHLALVFQAGDVELKSLVAGVYETAYTVSRKHGFNHLLRTWNYIDDINGMDQDLERYQTFCVARHEVLEAMNVLLQPNPAATAIGSMNGENCFVFLFSQQGGQVIENNRQVSAWQYPKQYSPKQPRFSRAMAVNRLLMCSGTASVVGHETQHLNDFCRQFEECIKNVGVLLAESSYSYELNSGLFRFYLRDEMYLVELRNCIEKHGIQNFVILHGDVCRENLLVECEAVFQ